MSATVFALLVVFLLAAALPVGMILVSALTGPRKQSAAKDAPYECGIQKVLGDARERFSVRFYLVAMLFIVFDIEVAFLYPWAILVRELGWQGLGTITLFLGILILGLVYAWKKGALEWE